MANYKPKLNPFTGSLQLVNDLSASINLDYTDVIYVDKYVGLVPSQQTGGLGAPYATIQQALDELGQPINADDYKRNILIEILTPGTYTEDLMVPHRAITIRGRGVVINGNITRQISDEKEYGVSSSIWRGTLSIIGSADNRDNHQSNRQGIRITGNYYCEIIPGETGNTTHDTYFYGVKIEGTVSTAVGVGNEILYVTNTIFKGDVISTSFYAQRWWSVQFDCDNVTLGTIVDFRDVDFINGDIWSGYNNLNLAITNFDAEQYNFCGCIFKLVQLTIPAGKSISLDANSHFSWKDEVTYVTNSPILILLSEASSVNNDSSVTGVTVKDALNTLNTNKLDKNGINGTFTTVDGKTITVVDGQITSIV